MLSPAETYLALLRVAHLTLVPACDLSHEAMRVVPNKRVPVGKSCETSAPTYFSEGAFARSQASGNA